MSCRMKFKVKTRNAYFSRIVSSYMPIEFGSTGNAIRSADPENPTLEPNMKWIRWLFADIWPFEFIQMRGWSVLNIYFLQGSHILLACYVRNVARKEYKASFLRSSFCITTIDCQWMYRYSNDRDSAQCRGVRHWDRHRLRCVHFCQVRKINLSQHCCKGDQWFQWETPKFQPPYSLFMNIKIGTNDHVPDN